MPDPVPDTPATAAPLGFRSILTFADGCDGDRARLAAAAAVARANDGHVTVIAIGYDASAGPYAFDGGAGAALLELAARAKEDADRLTGEALSGLEQEGALGDALPMVAGTGEISSRFARHARFADLVVIVPGAEPPLARTDHDIVEAALFEGDAPVLFQPQLAPPGEGGSETVMIGWDGSREALRAVRAALPVLARATRVEIAIFGDVIDEETPGEGLALMLSRHGIAVEVAAQPTPRGSVAEAISRRALEIGAGLTVMGAYGHSRFREALIGGVTRDLLDRAQIPLFMAH